MLELASLGAGVMHSRSIEFAKKYRVPLRVRPAYSKVRHPDRTAGDDADLPVVTGMAGRVTNPRVSLCDIPDRPGVMSLIFTKMAAAQDSHRHGRAGRRAGRTGRSLASPCRRTIWPTR